MLNMVEIFVDDNIADELILSNFSWVRSNGDKAEQVPNRYVFTQSELVVSVFAVSITIAV